MQEYSNKKKSDTMALSFGEKKYFKKHPNGGTLCANM